MRPGPRSSTFVTIATVATTLQVAPAFAQSFDKLPRVYTRQPQVFARLFQAARTKLVHGLIFGDSQETCPQGAGEQYIIHLNREFADWYGSCDATPWCQAGSSFGGGSPWGEWLVRAASAPPGPVLRPYPERWLPPGMQACTVSAMNGLNVNNNQDFGWLVFLDTNARWSHPDTRCDGHPFFETRSGVYLELMARSEPESSELLAKVATTNRHAPYYYENFARNYSTSMHLNDSKGEIRTQRLGPFAVPRGRSIQAEIGGTDPRRTATLISARFVAANPRGLVITDIAEGGYLSGTIADHHPDCGPVLARLGADFAIIAYGANDIAFGVPPASYRENITKLIRFIRSNTAPDLPVVILCDPYRSTSIPRQAATQEGLPAQAYKIAQSDPNVLFINSRRLTDDEGWTSRRYPDFCTDGVHYNSRGAEAKARAEARAILWTFACPADRNADGFADAFDLDAFLSHYEFGLPEADIDGDSFVDGFDLSEFLDAFERGCG